MTKKLTPEAAAFAARTNRSAIMRAIYSHDLKALRSNTGRWQIDRADLDAWVLNRTISDRSLIAMTESEPNQHDLTTIKVELGAAKARIEGLEARLIDAHAERDRLASMLTQALEARPVTRRRFWPF